MSTLNVATIKSKTALTPPAVQDLNGVGIGTFCRAWVNFNGSGTVAIRAAFNVTSITDNGVGDYTVNFTNAMPDANYGIFGTIQNNGTASTGSIAIYTAVAPTASGARIYSSNAAAASQAAYDSAYISVSVFR